MKYVISLEGPHGIGKTTLLEKFKEQNSNKPIPVIKENFLDNHLSSELKKTSMVSELAWISQWVSSVLKELETNNIVVTDRCPYSACIYTTSDKLLLRQLVDTIMEEFDSISVKIITVYMNVPIDITFERIKKRFSDENSLIRRALNEENYDFLLKIYKSYEQKKWSYTITNYDDFMKIITDITSYVT